MIRWRAFIVVLALTGFTAVSAANPTWVLSGTVVDPSDSPVASARVLVIAPELAAAAETASPETEPAEPNAFVETQSDEDGGFRLELEAAPPLHMIVQAPGWQTLHRVIGAEDLDGLRLTLQQGARLEGQVSGADGSVEAAE